MEIKLICTTWGMEESSLQAKLEKIKAAGYDGVEMGAPEDLQQRREAGEILDDLGLLFVAQQWSEGNTLDEQKESIEKQFLINAELEPVLINSHTGKDYFRFEDNLELLKFADKLSGKYDVEVAHETHRGRFAFSAINTLSYLERLPDLKLTADFSHWCCVSESLLEDQEHLLGKAIPRSRHLHARVGYAQGPQVTDPAAPEWGKAVNLHLEWWDRIITINRKNGRDLFTITPEFGPVPYLHTLPFSNKPVADQWDINVYMKNLLRDRYE